MGVKDKLKNIWNQSKTKDYTTIEPTQKSSIWRRLKNQADTSLVPLEYTEKKNEPLVRDYGLSTYEPKRIFQKYFTKKGKKAVEDLKLKSLKK